MKNRLIAAVTLCALLLCLALPAFAVEIRVIDDAGLYTSAEEAKLQTAIMEFQKETGMDYAIVTSSEPHDEDTDMQDRVDRYYEDNGYGLGDERSGMIYYVDMYGRREYLSTAGAMQDYMTNERLEATHDKSNPYMRTGSYAQAALAALEQVRTFVKRGIPEGAFRYDVITGRQLTARHKALTTGEILVSLLAGAVVALVVGLCVHRKYKLKGSTYHYDMKSNVDVKLTEQSDDYLRTTVSRTRKAPPPSSGGSGGGGFGGGGSGVHMSSGGMSHGGSSRGF